MLGDALAEFVKDYYRVMVFRLDEAVKGFYLSELRTCKRVDLSP